MVASDYTMGVTHQKKVSGTVLTDRFVETMGNQDTEKVSKKGVRYRFDGSCLMSGFANET